MPPTLTLTRIGGLLALALCAGLSGCNAPAPAITCEQYLDATQREDCKRRTYLPPLPAQPTPARRPDEGSLCYRKANGEQVCPN